MKRKTKTKTRTVKYVPKYDKLGIVSFVLLVFLMGFSMPNVGGFTENKGKYSEVVKLSDDVKEIKLEIKAINRELAQSREYDHAILTIVRASAGIETKDSLEINVNAHSNSNPEVILENTGTQAQKEPKPKDTGKDKDKGKDKCKSKVSTKKSKRCKK